MGETRRAVLFALGASGIALAAPARCGGAVSRTSLSGDWSGFLDSDDPPTRLRLVVGDDGRAGLTVFTTTEELAVPVSRLSIAGRELRLDVAQPALRYVGRLQADGSLRGTLVRGARRLPLSFVRGDLYGEPPFRAIGIQALSPGLLRELRQMARAPAMGVGWQEEGHGTHVLVDGRRSAALAHAVATDDQWHLGSVTKSVTATLAARLVEQGRIDWTTRLGDMLGDVAGPVPGPFRDVTLLHVLSHRGGLPRDLPDDALRRSPGMPDAAYVREALRLPAVARMGEETHYSNVDYVVAGLMLEVATGFPWQALVQQHVLSVLGIGDAVFAGAGEEEGVATPIGHSPGRTGLVPDRGDVPACMAAAGRIRMSLRSLLAYLAAHRDKPPGFLSARSWSVLHTPPFGGDYALGWDVSPEGMLSHGGTNQRWKCEVRVNPASRVVSCSAANVLNRNTQLALSTLLDCADATRDDPAAG